MAGMETPLYTLIILLALLALTQERTRLAAGYAGLAALMRLDGLAVIAVVILTVWLQKRRFPWSELLLFAVICVPWFLFALLYFGSPLPLSLPAKQARLLAAHGDRFLIWWHLFVLPIRQHLYLLPVMLVGTAGLLRKRTEWPRSLPILIWLGLYLTEYALAGIEFYEWYSVPALPVLACLAASGVLLIAEITHARWGTARQRTGLLVLLAGLIWILVPYTQNVRLSVEAFRQYLVGVEGSRAQAGAWLRDHVPGEEKVLARAIGHVGYISGRYILDGVGLVTPSDYLERSKPDYYVLDNRAPNDPTCGPVADFDTHWATTPFRTVVSKCSGSLAAFNTLTLAEARATDWVVVTAGNWEKAPRAYLETQWIRHEGAVDRDWTLYVHFTQPDGTLIAQADHPLGSQVGGAVVTPSRWELGSRIYDYVPLPEAAVADPGAIQIRLGLWEPASGDRVEARPVMGSLDPDGRLVVDLARP